MPFRLIVYVFCAGYCSSQILQIFCHKYIAVYAGMYASINLILRENRNNVMFCSSKDIQGYTRTQDILCVASTNVASHRIDHSDLQNGFVVIIYSVWMQAFSLSYSL